MNAERGVQPALSVLTVLDREISDGIEVQHFAADSTWANDLREARAAVAELIEAAGLIDQTLRLHAGSNPVYRGKVERFRAALARAERVS